MRTIYCLEESDPSGLSLFQTIYIQLRFQQKIWVFFLRSAQPFARVVQMTTVVPTLHFSIRTFCQRQETSHPRCRERRNRQQPTQTTERREEKSKSEKRAKRRRLHRSTWMFWSDSNRYPKRQDSLKNVDRCLSHNSLAPD